MQRAFFDYKVDKGQYPAEIQKSRRQKNIDNKVRFTVLFNSNGYVFSFRWSQQAPYETTTTNATRKY